MVKVPKDVIFSSGRPAWVYDKRDGWKRYTRRQWKRERMEKNRTDID